MVSYFDSGLQRLAQMQVKSGTVTGVKSFGNPIQPGRNGWGDCVSRQFQYYASAKGAAEGLLCVAFGVECAAGVALGCVISQFIPCEGCE